MKLSQAILATLKYSNHFAYPLTLSEIHARLIGYKAAPSQVNTELKKLITQKQVGEKSGYYFLVGRSVLVRKRLERDKVSHPQITQAKKYAQQLMKIKGVLAIYLTGSLAMHNAEKSADIDFMVITQPAKLWTTRLLLTLYTEIRGLRRRPHAKDGSRKLCLNLYLTPAAFTLPKTKRTLYTAYELIQALPLVDPHGTQAQLLSANSWMKSFLPNIALPNYKHKPVPTQASFLESLLYYLQRFYMQRKITREYITRDAAFFHPHDPSPKVE